MKIIAIILGIFGFLLIGFILYFLAMANREQLPDAEDE